MFEVVRQLPAPTVEDIKTFLDKNVRLEKDHSRYAPGRNRGWLRHEGPLTQSRTFKPHPCPARLWDWLEQVWAKSGMKGLPELGLAAHGQIGIDFHRDATYAAPEALLVNLGGVQWGYEPTRKVSTPLFHTFDSGEVVRFNCKHRHAALEATPERWSIILWRISHKRRAEFDRYLLDL